MVTHTVDLGNCIVIIKGIPSMICAQCGEIWYSGTVTKQIEKIVDAIKATAITEIAVVNFAEKIA